MLPHTTEGIDPDVARENPWKRSVRLSVHLIFKDLRHRVGEGKGLFIDETRSRGRVLNVRGKRKILPRLFLTSNDTFLKIKQPFYIVSNDCLVLSHLWGKSHPFRDFGKILSLSSSSKNYKEKYSVFLSFKIRLKYSRKYPYILSKSCYKKIRLFPFFSSFLIETNVYFP